MTLPAAPTGSAPSDTGGRASTGTSRTPAAGASVLGLQIGRRPRRVALAGNPNVGKTSLFNALTGLRQRVSNYPGITVERVSGTAMTPAGPVELLDLPGTYSLEPHSPDEQVARDALCGDLAGEPAPDVIVVVVDASNLERNLYLLTQVIELGRPLVVALNQVDLALREGVTVDADQLGRLFGVTVVPTCGRTGAGTAELLGAIVGARPAERGIEVVHPAEAVAAAERLEPAVAAVLADADGAAGCAADGAVEKATGDTAAGPAQQAEASPDLRRRLLAALCSESAAVQLTRSLRAVGGARGARAEEAVEALRLERERLAEEGVDPATTAATLRYAALEPLAEAIVSDPRDVAAWRRELDRVLLHPVVGSVVLLAVLMGLFMVVFSWSGPAIDWVDATVGGLGEWVAGALGDGLFSRFLQDGLIAGLGAFLVFVPQIAMLFICIEALEDSGYLARAAFLLDRIMGRAGLPGRSFLPLLSGFACAIPGVMATRTIPDRRDRFITMAVLPWMSCSARLPVYAVIVGALFAQHPAWVPSTVVLSMYLLGILMALAGARLLRSTLLRGDRGPLLLELPAYRAPSPTGVIKNTARRTWTFVTGAGPIILVFSVALWGLLQFPRDVSYSRDYDTEIAALAQDAATGSPAGAEELEARVTELGSMRDAERLEHSYMGRAGKLIEPAIRPLGYDWKIGIAIIASFAAREVFVPTLGVIYAVGDEADEESEGLLQSMRNDRRPDGTPVFTPLVGISLLVFYVLALQCMSTLAAIKREMNSWRWPAGMFVAYTVIAYVASLIVYQGGLALGLG